MSTKAQQTFERVNALVEGGMQKADAFKQLAEEYRQPVDSVRGAYYGAKRAAGGQSASPRRRPVKRETTTEDAIASAVATLKAAVDSIESELEAARERAEEATAEYAAMQAASSGRIEQIRAKIAVLDPEAATDDSSVEPPAATEAPPAEAPPVESAVPAAKPEASKPTRRREVKGS